LTDIKAVSKPNSNTPKKPVAMLRTAALSLLLLALLLCSTPSVMAAQRGARNAEELSQDLDKVIQMGLGLLCDSMSLLDQSDPRTARLSILCQARSQ
ncbi:hypothetical protein BOX15_Mlig022408g1, partial [Macrostomum lignano]